MSLYDSSNQQPGPIRSTHKGFIAEYLGVLDEGQLRQIQQHAEGFPNSIQIESLPNGMNRYRVSVLATSLEKIAYIKWSLDQYNNLRERFQKLTSIGLVPHPVEDNLPPRPVAEEIVEAQIQEQEALLNGYMRYGGIGLMRYDPSFDPMDNYPF